MRLVLVSLLALSVVHGPALADDRRGERASSEEAGAIAGGRVTLWEPALGRITIALSKKHEVVLSTAGAVINGAPGVGRVVDVTYTGDRAEIITVRP